MKLFTIVFERLPMVWFLLGLLFISTGLYVGFDNSLSFVYMIVGLFSCAFGLALFLFQLGNRRKANTSTRLSPNFISAGSEDTTTPARDSGDSSEQPQTG